MRELITVGFVIFCFKVFSCETDKSEDLKYHNTEKGTIFQSLKSIFTVSGKL